MKPICSILCFVLLLSTGTIFAQGPDHSAKLEKEKGFNLLKIGASLSSVKSVLLKDTVTSWEPEDASPDFGISSVYLVDLKKPGYAQFLGATIARIEVYISDVFGPEEGKPVVWKVKIFFKKTSNKEASDLFARMFKEYGSASPVVDMPRKGDEQITWFSEDVMMYGVSFFGTEENPKDGYFKVEFGSAKGG